MIYSCILRYMITSQLHFHRFCFTSITDLLLPLGRETKPDNSTIFLPWKASVEEAREWGRKLENGTKHLLKSTQNEKMMSLTEWLFSLRCDLIYFQVWGFISLLFRCIFNIPEFNHDYNSTTSNVSLALQFVTHFIEYPLDFPGTHLNDYLWLPGNSLHGKDYPMYGMMIAILRI